ncbi:serine/threonine protein kinase, partial [Nonomuraea aridisoli]
TTSSPLPTDDGEEPSPTGTPDDGESPDTEPTDENPRDGDPDGGPGDDRSGEDPILTSVPAPNTTAALVALGIVTSGAIPATLAVRRRMAGRHRRTR